MKTQEADRMPFTAREWRDRAAEARARAEEMRDAEAKDVMRSIAASYDRLTEMAEGAYSLREEKEVEAWRVRAAAYRRMAETAKDVERERKLLALASDYEARAESIERAPSGGRDS